MEEWRVVPRNPEYEASSLGRIRRIEATRTRPAGHILKTKVDRYGYLKVALYSGGKPRHTQVHRIVCEAFNGDQPTPHHEAAHGNGVRADCRSANLRWATKSENTYDRYAHGSAPPLGSKHWNASLTEELVVEARARVSAGERMKDIAAEMGVAPSTMSQAIKGVTWQHLKS